MNDIPASAIWLLGILTASNLIFIGVKLDDIIKLLRQRWDSN